MVATALQPTLPGRTSTSTSVGSANVAQASTLEMLSNQPTAVEQQKTADLQEQFQQQAQKDPAGFRTALREAFGDKADLAQIDRLLNLALSGKLPMPSNIQFVEAGSLGSGALGAYDANDGGSLYLDSSLQSDPDKLQSVFNEEMGHHLDALLGGADAAGDEGAVFARTLEQGPLSQTELTALKSENDHGVIEIEGQWVQVEFHAEGGAGSGGEGGEGGGDSGSGSGSGGGTGSDGGAESGGGAGTAGSADSGGGECGADSGSAGSGTSGSDSAGDTSGDSGSGDAGGECGIGDGNDTGDTQNANGPEDRDDNTSNHHNDDPDPARARTEAPSEAQTEDNLNTLSYAGTAANTLDALNQKVVQGIGEAQLPDDVKTVNRAVAGGLKAFGHTLTGMDPALAAIHEARRAASEGEDLGEQTARGITAAVKRADNVAATMAGTAVGSLSGNPIAATAVGAATGYVYGGSPLDNAFDSSVDALAGEIESPTTNVRGYTQPAPSMTVDQGWANIGRLR